ncbi:MAG: hypothetical protein JXL84_10255 [Deltaproteobacteria bacterium]|nr:hypothetical protein [Deltaproteobacteria bacterium]
MRLASPGHSDGRPFRSARPFAVFLTVGLLLFTSGECPGGVFTAEQIIRFISARVSVFETLLVDQSIRQEGWAERGQVRIFTERLWMKSPDLIHSEVPEGFVKEAPCLDHRHLQLFLRNSPTDLIRILSAMGIDFGHVDQTRSEDSIAYWIGGETPQSPGLVIEKERFLPLLLVRPSADPKRGVTVQFADYRRVEQGWYPFRVRTLQGDQAKCRHTVHSVRANVLMDFLPADPSSRASPGSETWTLEREEKLDRVIRAFLER